MGAEFFVSASIVTYNDINRAPNTVESILKYTKKYPLKLYVIDNASTDDTAELIEESGQAIVIKNAKNIGCDTKSKKRWFWCGTQCCVR